MIGDPLELRTEDDVIIASLRGEIDLANAKTVAGLIGSAVPNDATGVVLDLADVTYLDSSGVHLVFELNERLRSRQQRLTISLPPDSRVGRVLELVNVKAIVPMEPSVEDALARLRAQPA